MNSQSEIIQSLRPGKIVIPIAIGLLAVVLLLYFNFDADSLTHVKWRKTSILWLLCALLCAVVRQFGYMWRLRILSGLKLRWRDCFDVIALWEFTSSITPTMVGGTAVAVFFLTKEKIKPGEATTMILTTILLDAIFFISLSFFFLIVLGSNFIVPNIDGAVGKSWLSAFILAIIAMIGYSGLIAYGLFIKPAWIKRFMHSVGSVRILKRWKDELFQMGDDVEEASKRIRVKPLGYWIRGYMSTSLAWLARFAVVNCIMLAFIDVSDQMLLIARQISLYLIMMLTPSPGAVGVADLAFTDFFSDFVTNDGLASAIGALWRLLTYYPYLILGVFVLPRWLVKVANKKEES